MSRGAPEQDIDENALRIGEPGHAAADVKGVVVSLQRGWEQMGLVRTADAAAAEPAFGLRL